ncbi:MAG TPA: 4-hydroxy-3-methylbut-2-enyl diphosphate reductase [Planctomycetota bacterium]|nr:4-hydroxy-3-methylbut-2-enyl diphosphate reductase [Planctomycetota bacterium]
MKVYLASPRGFCAGVERAIEIVERALELYGPPVYVRKEIVHNEHVVADLRRRGAVFVDEVSEVPAGAVTIYSAHGVSPAVREAAKGRGLFVVDATCPLVAKVHVEAVKFAEEKLVILMIGHKDHEEVDGTMGEAPDRMHLVQSTADVATLPLSPDTPVAVLTQTTLSVDDTAEIIAAVRRRFRDVRLPKSDDICYATQNRQTAVKTLAKKVDLVLVIGSENSSNSRRLAEVAVTAGARSHLVGDKTHLKPEWFDGVSAVAVTAGASAPEVLVRELIDRLVAEFGGRDVEEVELVAEDVRFALPPEVQRAVR